MTLEKQIEIMKGWAEKASAQMAFPVLFEKDIARLLEWLEDYKQLKEHFETLPDWLPVWVSCDEAMPEEGLPVLIFSENTVKISALDKSGLGFLRNGEFIGAKLVTHWMPLPDPPKTQSRGVTL